MEVTKLSQGRQNTQNLSLNNLDNNAGSAVNESAEHTFAIVFPAKNSDAIPSSNGKKADEKDVKSAAEKINKLMEGSSTHIEYEVHDKFKDDIIVKIVDNDTHKVVKEIPPKKILDMVAKLCELAGVLIDQKA